MSTQDSWGCGEGNKKKIACLRNSFWNVTHSIRGSAVPRVGQTNCDKKTLGRFFVFLCVHEKETHQHGRKQEMA